MALDLVSLLVAQQKPGPASLTMSPIIKQTLPTGSINAEVVKKPEESEAKAQQDEMTHMGWKMQSLNKAADSLHASASRLEKEVEKETAYWDQVLAVKQKGWSLSRLPREKHTLGVHYGLAEGKAYSCTRLLLLKADLQRIQAFVTVELLPFVSLKMAPSLLIVALEAATKD